MKSHSSAAPVKTAADTETSRAYVLVGLTDRAWFAAHPERRYLLRPAAVAERIAHAKPGRVITHMLVARFGPRGRVRWPAWWQGPIPECDRALERVAAGAVFQAQGGTA